MKTQILSYRSLVVWALVLGGVAPLPADGGDFRIRIPNPLPRIANRIEKVGGFFARTARRLEGAEDDEDLRRDSPSRDYPKQPSRSQSSDMRTPLPRDDSRRRDDAPYLIEQDGRLLGTTQSKPQPQPQKLSLSPETPVRLNDLGAPNIPPPSNETPPVTQSPDPRGAVKPREPLSSSKTRSTTGTPPADVTTTAPAPVVKATPPPKHLYGRLVPNRPGLVYPPGSEQIPANMVDVRGITPGTKVRDPATGVVFLVP